MKHCRKGTWTKAPSQPGGRPGLLTAIALTGWVLALPVGALGQNVPAESAVATLATVETAGPVDRATLEAFLDGLMAAQMSEKGVAGAVVSVVRDGELFFTKGYGYSHVAERTPVDPHRTLFRIGSVTKLFTWTAVMQLAQEGRIDLDADINQYLPFQVPATFPEPITMRHLLQHTPGFEEDSRGLFTDTVEGLVPMERWLADNMPARVRPPGSFSAYSNYGTALAGLIVEQVSGLSWDRYLEERIFAPLGMEWTSGRQPLPEHLAPSMSEGYSRRDGGWEPESWELITGAAPAGSMSSTAVDMAAFMLAHLGGGRFGEERILAGETAGDMHRASFHHDSRIPGFGLGFYEKSSHGVRIIGHGGNTRWFHTDLALFPELGLGVFVSYNSEGGGDLSFGGFLNAFLDEYFPQEPPGSLMAVSGWEGEVSGLTGNYRFNRSSYTTFQKAFDLAGGVEFRAGGDGVLLMSGLGAEPSRLVREDPTLFREEFGQRRVVFRLDAQGRATHAFVSEAPMMGLERVGWYERPGLHHAILALGLLTFLGILIAGLTRGIRRLRGRGEPAPDAALSLGRRAMFASSLFHLSFAVAALVLLSDPWALITGSMTPVYLLLALPVLGLLATAVAGGAAIRSVREGGGNGWLRVRLCGAVSIALLLSWSLYYWNLLGWRM